MKYLILLTACAGLAIAGPTLSSRQDTFTKVKAVCEWRKFNEKRCNHVMDQCNNMPNGEKFVNCVEKIDKECAENSDCGDRLICPAVAPENSNANSTRSCKLERKQDQCTEFQGDPVQCLETVKKSCGNDGDCGDGFVCRAAAQANAIITRRCKVATKEERICKERKLDDVACQNSQAECTKFQGDALQCLEIVEKLCSNDGDCGDGFICQAVAQVNFDRIRRCKLETKEDGINLASF